MLYTLHPPACCQEARSLSDCPSFCTGPESQESKMRPRVAKSVLSHNGGVRLHSDFGRIMNNLEFLVFYPKESSCRCGHGSSWDRARGSHGSTTGTDGQQAEAQESLGKLEKQSRLGSLRRAQSTETMTATKSCLHSATPTALHTVAGIRPVRHS